MSLILLAKRPQNSNSPAWEETLLGHSLTTVQSFQAMFGSSLDHPTRLAHSWQRFFKLPQNYWNKFYESGLIACAFHDGGKGTEIFLDILNKKRRDQVIRHEHLSGLLLWLPPIRNWLMSIPHAEIHVVLSAVIGHHLRAGFQDFAEPLNPDLKCFKIFSKEVLQIFCQLGSLWENFPVSKVKISSLWNFESGCGFDLNEVKADAKAGLTKFKRKLKIDRDLNRLLIAVRAALILADSAASAILRTNHKIPHWIETAFQKPLTGEFIDSQVIAPRIAEIRAKQGCFTWNGFQQASESLPERVLLLAPCGSGKTLAAWRWIKSQIDKRPTSRVIFLYPTRATATEGFRDYLSWAPEADAALIHGTAAYELEGMFDDPKDARFGKDFTTEDRLYALGFWHRRIFSATVDQFLGFMQQVYRSICLLPLLADSVLVVDEVHSFDPKLFSAFKLFLKNFDLPVLCMTASLSPERKRALKEDCDLEIFPKDLKFFHDLEVQAAMPRYNIQLLEGEDLAREIAIQSFQEGKRVLWVVNKVDRCQWLARSLSALCYHSRFKLSDRKRQHDAVINAFKTTKAGEPILAITTQVCEMSLDLDTQVLISEYAPLTSLIQRLGRCNRRALQDGDPLGQVYFYPPEDQKPYTPEDLTGLNSFLKTMANKVISQQFLEQLLETYGPTEYEAERYAAFLENGPWAVAREESLRDTNDYTVEAVLDDDLGKYLQLRKQRQSADALIVPVPRQWGQHDPRIGRFPMVAPISHYDLNFGFFNYPLEYIS